MLREVKATSEDTEGFVNYALSLDGVQVALLFSETPGGTKVSFRSKADAHVNEWARAFGGGGHRNASGAFVERPLQEVIEKVVGASPRFLDLPPPDDDGELTPEDASYLSSLLDLKSQKAQR
jgi:phosphoesterase RecJ-like protein